MSCGCKKNKPTIPPVVKPVVPVDICLGEECDEIISANCVTFRKDNINAGVEKGDTLEQWIDNFFLNKGFDLKVKDSPTVKLEGKGVTNNELVAKVPFHFDTIDDKGNKINGDFYIDENGSVRINFNTTMIERILNTISNNSGLSSIFCKMVSNCANSTLCGTNTDLKVIINCNGDSIISWTPFNLETNVGQLVQIKRSNSLTWETFSTVSKTVNSISVPNLLSNILYDFRIVTKCSYGDNQPGSTVTQACINCPTLTTNVLSDSIEYAFDYKDNDITNYVLNLTNTSTGVTVNKIHNLSVPHSAGSLTGIFTNLIPSTTYSLSITVNIGNISQTCQIGSITTKEPPICGIPTSITSNII